MSEDHARKHIKGVEVDRHDRSSEGAHGLERTAIDRVRR
jgi:hypothetical protein